MNAGDQLFAVERLGHVIVSPEAEAADLGIHFRNPRKDQHRGLHFGDTELFQHVITMHIGQVEIEQDDIVIVQLAQIQAFFAQIGRIDIEAFGGQHQFDGPGRGRLVFDQQHAHG